MLSANKAIGRDRIEAVVEQGRNGCSCSEAIMAVYGVSAGLTREAALKAAGGFGGGIGLRGDTCGAVNAAVMALGLMFGTADLTDKFTRQKTYLLVDEFAERFIALKGSLECRSLCGEHDLSSPEGAKALRESGRVEGIIRTAAELLEEITIREQTTL